MSQQNNLFQNLFGAVQNILNDSSIQENLQSIMSKISSELLTCDMLKKFLENNPDITNEFMTTQINSAKEKHPEIQELINKYLKLDDSKTVYKIREFVQSNRCEEALNDPEMKKYMSQFMNSKEGMDKIKKMLTKTDSYDYDIEE